MSRSLLVVSHLGLYQTLITGTLLKDKQAQQDTDLDQGHMPTVTEPGSELADA